MMFVHVLSECAAPLLSPVDLAFVWLMVMYTLKSFERLAFSSRLWLVVSDEERLY